MTDLSVAPSEIEGHGLLTGKVVLVTAAAAVRTEVSSASVAIANSSPPSRATMACSSVAPCRIAATRFRTSSPVA